MKLPADGGLRLVRWACDDPKEPPRRCACVPLGIPFASRLVPCNGGDECGADPVYMAVMETDWGMTQAFGVCDEHLPEVVEEEGV